MAKQYHFVVYYDTDNDSFHIDYDTQDTMFQGAPIFDTDSAGWEDLEDSHWGDPTSAYVRAGDALYEATKALKTK